MDSKEIFNAINEELKYHHDKINELINVVNELLKRNQKLEDEIEKLGHNGGN